MSFCHEEAAEAVERRAVSSKRGRKHRQGQKRTQDRILHIDGGATLSGREPPLDPLSRMEICITLRRTMFKIRKLEIKP